MLCLYLLIKLIWSGFTPIIDCQMSLCQQLLLIGRESLINQPDLNSSRSDDSGTYRVQYHQSKPRLEGKGLLSPVGIFLNYKKLVINHQSCLIKRRSRLPRTNGPKVN